MSSIIFPISAVAATQAETTAGTSNTKFVTPAGLAGSSPSLTAVTLPAGDVQTQLNTVSNTRRPAQGLNFDGTGTAAIASVPGPKLNNFTLRTKFNSANTGGGYRGFLGNSAGTSLFWGIHTINDELGITLQGGTWIGSGYIVVMGEVHEYSYTRFGTTGTFFVDGKAVATVTDANNYSGVIDQFGGNVNYPGNTAPGTFYGWNILNRGLSAAEVLSTYETGVLPSDCFPATPAGTTLNTSAFLNVGYDTFSGASATGFAAVKTGGGSSKAKIAPLFSGKVGDRIAVSFTATLTSGEVPFVYCSDEAVSAVYSNLYRPTAGANTVIFTLTSPSSRIYFEDIAASSFLISAFTATPLGCLFAPDEAQPGGGPVWVDVSGNGAHLYLPTSGVTWAQPCGVGATVAIPHTFLHSAISSTGGTTLFDTIPYGWAPIDWQVWVDVAFDSGTTIDVGSSSTQNRYVSAQNVASTGAKQATPLVLTASTTSTGSAVYITKSGSTTTGDLLTAVLTIRKIF